MESCGQPLGFVDARARGVHLPRAAPLGCVEGAAGEQRDLRSVAVRFLVSSSIRIDGRGSRGALRGALEGIVNKSKSVHDKRIRGSFKSHFILSVIFHICYFSPTVMAAGHLGAELEEAGAWSAYAVDRRYP